MQPSTALYDFVYYFLSPFADVLSYESMSYLVTSCTIFLLSLLVGGIISATFGAISALAALRGRGK